MGKKMKRNETRKLIDIFSSFQHKFRLFFPPSWSSEFSCCYVPHSQAYLIPSNWNLYILGWKKKNRQLVIRLKTIERNQRLYCPLKLVWVWNWTNFRCDLIHFLLFFSLKTSVFLEVLKWFQNQQIYLFFWKNSKFDLIYFWG